LEKVHFVPFLLTHVYYIASNKFVVLYYLGKYLSTCKVTLASGGGRSPRGIPLDLLMVIKNIIIIIYIIINIIIIYNHECLARNLLSRVILGIGGDAFRT
jgi:hypothetical protein